MHIPLRHPTVTPQYHPLPVDELPDFPSFASSLPSSGDWSSIIGIVTAIIGNILISIALNTQRYAHVRLEREAHGESPTAEHHKHEPGHAAEDHQIRRQSQIADEISKHNKQSKPVKEDGQIDTYDYHDEGHQHEEEHASANETSPLLSKDQANGSTTADGSNNDTSSIQVDEKHEPHEKKNYLRSKLWWLGIALMTVGEAGNFLAYGFAPASVVSPLGVVALISNCLIAPLMLHEKFRKRDPLGVVISVAGAVTVVLSAKGSNPKLGPDQILNLIKQWEFLTYLGITVAAIGVLMVMSNRYGHRTIIIDIGLVGLFGGYTALSTKGVASLLSYRFFQVVTYPITYLLVVVLVGTAVMQIKYVNRALQRFDSTVVIPTQFCTFTIFVVVGSAILYRDFESMTGAKVGQFVGGVALTFLGVWVITTGRKDGSDDYDEEEDEEQQIDMVDDTVDGVPSEQTPDHLMSKSEPLLTRASPSPPSTPKAQPTPAETAAEDTPMSFKSAISNIDPSTPTPSPKKKASLSTTTSSPLLLPSQQRNLLTRSQSQNQQASQSRLHLHPPSTPLTRTQRPASPSHAASDSSTYQTPSSTSTANTPGTTTSTTSNPRQSLTRNITGLSGSLLALPGPYTSPLSSGLSVVVADSRRRDERASLALGRRRSQRSSVPRRGSLTRTQTSTQTQTGGQRGSASSTGFGSNVNANANELVNANELIRTHSGTEDGAAAVSALQRPGIGGRGNTVEVAGSSSASATRSGSGTNMPLSGASMSALEQVRTPPTVVEMEAEAEEEDHTSRGTGQATVERDT